MWSRVVKDLWKHSEAARVSKCVRNFGSREFAFVLAIPPVTSRVIKDLWKHTSVETAAGFARLRMVDGDGGWNVSLLVVFFVRSGRTRQMTRHAPKIQLLCLEQTICYALPIITLLGQRLLRHLFWGNLFYTLL